MQLLEKDCSYEVMYSYATVRETVAKFGASVILFMPTREIRALLKNNGKAAFSFYFFVSVEI